MKEVRNSLIQAQSAAKIMDRMREELLEEGFVETAPEIFTREAGAKPKGKRRRRRIRVKYNMQGYPL
jgi:hypothetical protein